MDINKRFTNSSFSKNEQNEKNELDCIPIIGLVIGMKVMALDKPWEESSFPHREFIIESQNDIDALRKECLQVYIERGEDSAGMSIIQENKPPKVHNWG